MAKNTVFPKSLLTRTRTKIAQLTEDEQSIFSPGSQTARAAVIAQLVDIAHAAMTFERQWQTRGGVKTQQAPDFRAATMCWVEIGKLCGLHAEQARHGFSDLVTRTLEELMESILRDLSARRVARRILSRYVDGEGGGEVVTDGEATA